MLAVSHAAHAQVDDRLTRFNHAPGSRWRVFAVDVHPTGPLGIAGVQEVRQQLPPSFYAVIAANTSAAPIAEYVIAAVVVTSDGSVKAVQQLPPVKNVMPGQSRRQETPIRVTMLRVTDRVAFVPYQIKTAEGTWKVADAEMRSAIKLVAQGLAVP